MELESSRVYRNLEMRLKVAGIDTFDLLLALLFSGVMNLIFGGTALGLYFVLFLPALILGILHMAKRNRPDKFLEHCLRYYFLPAYWSAGRKSLHSEKRKKKIYGRIGPR